MWSSPEHPIQFGQIPSFVLVWLLRPARRDLLIDIMVLVTFRPSVTSVLDLERNAGMIASRNCVRLGFATIRARQERAYLTFELPSTG